MLKVLEFVIGYYLRLQFFFTMKLIDSNIMFWPRMAVLRVVIGACLVLLLIFFNVHISRRLVALTQTPSKVPLITIAPTPHRRLLLEPSLVRTTNHHFENRAIQFRIELNGRMIRKLICQFGITSSNESGNTTTASFLSGGAYGSVWQCQIPLVVLSRPQVISLHLLEPETSSAQPLASGQLLVVDVLLSETQVLLFFEQGPVPLRYQQGWYLLQVEASLTPSADKLSAESRTSIPPNSAILRVRNTADALQSFPNSSVAKLHVSSGLFHKLQPPEQQIQLLAECARVLGIEGELEIDLRCGPVCLHPGFQSALTATISLLDLQVRHLNSTVIVCTHRKRDYTLGVYRLSKDEFPFRLTDAVQRPWLLQYPQPAVNPVLSAVQVRDAEALFLADPFLAPPQSDRVLYLFFELMIAAHGNRSDACGVIAVANSTDGGGSWQYDRIVIHDAQIHLSYPLVLTQGSEYFLIPETYQANQVRLYRAVEFPYRWELETVLLEGMPFSDATLVQYENRWWMFVLIYGKPWQMALYYSTTDSIRGPWHAHPYNPIRTGYRYTRCAGRALVHDGKLYRFSQDGEIYYGLRVDMHLVELLTLTEYRERLLQPGFLPHRPAPATRAWNTKIHHVDFLALQDGTWLVVIDGCDSLVCQLPVSDARPFDLELAS